MINCTQRFIDQLKRGDRPAISLDGHSVSFYQLAEMAGGVQKQLDRLHIKPGDAALVFDRPSPRLFASLIALMAKGCPVIFVEPWMSLPDLNEVLDAVKPKLFLTNGLGRLWGWRSAAVRSINHWINIRAKPQDGPLEVCEIADESAAIITFTTGTTGRPKGVVRSHGYLLAQLSALNQNLSLEHIEGPDLCLFGNFVLANLALGRPSVLAPQKPKKNFFHQLEELKPVSLSCGPAFLLQLIRSKSAPPLTSVHIGGALTDCWIFEEGFKRWPNAHWLHVYGSSEAEPVSTVEAKEAVAKSREAGFFQTLYLGQPVRQIAWKTEGASLWVSGKHVCPAYIGDDDANAKNKVIDSQGKLWHRMGDRVLAEGGFWYRGRSHLPEEDFLLEQRVYSFLKSSRCFVHRAGSGERYLLGEKLPTSLTKRFENLKGIVNTKIYRDRRHGARIDREKTLRKGTPWLIG